MVLFGLISSSFLVDILAVYHLACLAYPYTMIKITPSNKIQTRKIGYFSQKYFFMKLLEITDNDIFYQTYIHLGIDKSLFYATHNISFYIKQYFFSKSWRCNTAFQKVFMCKTGFFFLIICFHSLTCYSINLGFQIA